MGDAKKHEWDIICEIEQLSQKFVQVLDDCLHAFNIRTNMLSTKYRSRLVLSVNNKYKDKADYKKDLLGGYAKFVKKGDGFFGILEPIFKEAVEMKDLTGPDRSIAEKIYDSFKKAKKTWC